MATGNPAKQTTNEGREKHPRNSAEGEQLVKRHRRRHFRDEYAKTILSYSQLSVTQSLYAGIHFEELAHYLQRSYDVRTPDIINSNNTQGDETPGTHAFDFVTLYNLDPSAKEREAHIKSPKVFESKAMELAESPHGRLIFMRGHPSPEWLLAIGATYQVDPEFFRRHLDFCPGLRDHYLLPSLPSTSQTALTLRVTTIGASIAKFKTVSEQNTIETLREENRLRVNDYRESLRGFTQMNLGDSIVREFSVHDSQQFSIEQDISLHVGTCGKGWFALIWLDVTNNVNNNVKPFFTNPLRTGSWAVSSVPVIRHQPGLAPRQTPKVRELIANGTKLSCPIPSAGLVQNACWLHLDYGLNLDKNLAARNSFYALHEIVMFTACAENQFLNMLETKLLKELDPAFLIRQTQPTLSNLLYNQRVLDRHTQRIRDNLATIKAGNSSGWPRTKLEPDQQRIVDQITENLINDYEYLLSRSLVLSEQCSRGMQVVMNNAMVKESRDAIIQAEGVAKLTRLAFIFVPLSFTASFFGMNFAQFGQGSLHIWIWFAVSVPIFIISLLSMKWDIIGTSMMVMKRTENAAQRGNVDKLKMDPEG